MAISKIRSTICVIEQTSMQKRDSFSPSAGQMPLRANRNAHVFLVGGLIAQVVSSDPPLWWDSSTQTRTRAGSRWAAVVVQNAVWHATLCKTLLLSVRGSSGAVLLVFRERAAAQSSGTTSSRRSVRTLQAWAGAHELTTYL